MNNDNEVSVTFPGNACSRGRAAEPLAGEHHEESREWAPPPGEVTRRVRNPLLRPAPPAAELEVSAATDVGLALSNTGALAVPYGEISENIHVLVPANDEEGCSDDTGADAVGALSKARYKGLFVIAVVVVVGAAIDIGLWRTSAKRDPDREVPGPPEATSVAARRPTTLSGSTAVSMPTPQIAPLPSQPVPQTNVQPAEASVVLADKEASIAPLKRSASQDRQSSRVVGKNRRKPTVKRAAKPADEVGMEARAAATRRVTAAIDETDPYAP
jgi:hypothetical protein